MADSILVLGFSASAGGDVKDGLVLVRVSLLKVRDVELISC